LHLNLTLDRDNVGGHFNVRKLGVENSNEWRGVGITGKRTFSRIKCKIIHVRNGEVLNFGQVILSKKTRNIKWVLKKEASDFFPKETILFPASIPS